MTGISDVIRAVENITDTYVLKVEGGYVSIVFPFPETGCKCGGDCKCKEAEQ